MIVRDLHAATITQLRQHYGLQDRKVDLTVGVDKLILELLGEIDQLNQDAECVRESASIWEQAAKENREKLDQSRREACEASQRAEEEARFARYRADEKEDKLKKALKNCGCQTYAGYR